MGKGAHTTVPYMYGHKIMIVPHTVRTSFRAKGLFALMHPPPLCFCSCYELLLHCAVVTVTAVDANANSMKCLRVPFRSCFPD